VQTSEFAPDVRSVVGPILAGLTALVLLAACNHEPNVTEIDYAGAGGGKIYLLTQSRDSNDDDDAELSGTLVLSEGCLRVKDGARNLEHDMAVIWPKGFGLEVQGDDVRVLNTQGEQIAEVGASVYLGGSGVYRSDPTDREGGCNGPFWSMNTNDTVRTIATATVGL